MPSSITSKEDIEGVAQERPVFIIHTFIIIKFQLSNMYRVGRSFYLKLFFIRRVLWVGGEQEGGRMDDHKLLLDDMWPPKRGEKLFPC